MAVPSLLHFSRADAHVKSGRVILPLIVIAMFARMIAGVNREGRGGEPFRSCRGPREAWSRASLKHASSPRTAAVGLLLFIYPRFRSPLSPSSLPGRVHQPPQSTDVTEGQTTAGRTCQRDHGNRN